MSQASKDSKPRATKNSQRLYNLEEQERLYKNLGVTTKPGIMVNPENKEENLEDLVDSELKGEQEPEGKSEGSDGSPDSKKKKRRSKESSIMSESESDQESEPEKKQKKKKKTKNQDPGFSPRQNKGKKLKTQTGLLQKKGKKSPLGTRSKSKKQKVNLSQPGIRLPSDLLQSPEDSSVIEAHMNAYTKWLFENNMLVSQQSLNQFARPREGEDMAPPKDNMADVPSGSGHKSLGSNTQNTQFIPKRVDVSGRNAHNISTDESSNVDGSEIEGHPPFAPAKTSNILQASKNINLPAPSVNQDNGELFNVCEAEKDVPLEEDSSVGPEVSEQMALMIKNFLGRNRKAAKIDDLLTEFIRPKNMPFLKPPMIEDEIYLDLASGARHFDKNCRLLQGYIFAAMTALATSLQSLILTEKLHPIITDAGVKVKKAIQLLAFSTREINDRRKDALKSSVNPDYLPLLKHAKPPSDDWLLGGELNESIKKCDDSKKLSEKIMKNKKPQQNQTSQGQQQQHHQNGQYYPQNQEKFKYKNRGRKDAKPYYRNYQNQGSQQTTNYHGSYHQPQNPQYIQPAVQQQQQQQNQLLLWQQYQQQLQQAQALQNQAQNRQNLGFQQNQQWKDQPQQQQGYNSYNQKKKN